MSRKYSSIYNQIYDIMLKSSLIVLIISCAYLVESVQDCPGGTECPSGCCPIPNAFCCEDNVHCAIRPLDCPFRETQNAKKLIVGNEKGSCGIQCSGGCCPMEKAICCQGSNFCASSIHDCPLPDRSFKSAPLRQNKDLCPGGTECPSGCCPIENAVCCPDNIYCAVSLKNCPKRDLTKILIPAQSKDEKNCPGGTECPSGCCPIENAVCCPDGIYCAKSKDKCPKGGSVQRIVSSITKGSDNCPGGKECPSGCCPIPNAFCCPDNIYCATSESKCPKRSLLKGMIKSCPNGTECPSGCCNIPNAYCCPDNIYCATSAENCPNSSFVNKIKPF